MVARSIQASSMRALRNSVGLVTTSFAVVLAVAARAFCTGAALAFRTSGGTEGA